MLSFASAVFLLIITPGPGVLSLAGVGAAYGYKAGLRYFIGLFIGTNLVAFAVITGLAGIMLSMPVLRNVLLIASALYLGYLAFKIATAGSRIAFIEANSSPGILNGIALQAINPKAYAVNTTFFSGFAYAVNSPVFETVTKLLIINAIWIPIHVLWMAAGVNLKRLAISDTKQRAINIIMALSMLGVVVLALLSQT